MMNTEEQAIAKIILERNQEAGKTVQFRDLAKVTDVVVALNPGAGTYDYVSGPEFHTVGTPRRRRKVWSVRFDVRDGVAAGGWAYATSLEDAVKILNERRARTEPFCACGRRVSECDGSRRGCATRVEV